MADIFNIVNYDLAIPVTIYSDKTGDIVFNVRSIDNADAQNLFSKSRTSAILSSAKGGKADGEGALGKILETMINPPLDILATCVVSWEWNGHAAGDLGADPELTPENAAKVLGIKWIKEKVQPVAQNIENFTTA